MTTEAKKAFIKQLSDKNGVISALAIDQRGALKKMINKYQDTEAQGVQIEDFKKIVSSELTQYASSILLDPEYGLKQDMTLQHLVAYLTSCLSGRLNVLKKQGLTLVNSCFTTMWMNVMKLTTKRKLSWNGSVQNVRQKIYHSS